MDGVRLPPLANVIRLLAGHLAVDVSGKVDHLNDRLQKAGTPVAFLICRGGDLDHEASKLELLANSCRDLAVLEDGAKKLQVVLLVSDEASEKALCEALQKLPAAFGGSMPTNSVDASSEGPTGAAFPSNPQPPWIGIACVPSEAEVFGSMIEQRTEMLVLLLDVLGSATGRLAFFSPDGAGLAREGQVVLEEYGAVAAWPFSEDHIRSLELGSDAPEGTGSMRKKHPLPDLFQYPAGSDSGILVQSSAQDGSLSSVPVKELQDSVIVCLYFGASWCEPCIPLTRKLQKTLTDVRAQHGAQAMSVVYISYDEAESSFNMDVKHMPEGWLALPFNAAAASREKLSKDFGMRGIPSIILLKGDGTLVSTEGRELINELGAVAFPFSPNNVSAAREAQRLHQQKQREEMTLQTILSTPDRDYVVNSKGDKIQVSELEAKHVPVALFFSSQESYLCSKFREQLLKVYQELKDAGKPLEVVLISMDDSEDALKEHMRDAPWLALPHMPGGNEAARLSELRSMFDGVKGLPALIVLDENGKIRAEDGAERIRETGSNAYPFL